MNHYKTGWDHAVDLSHRLRDVHESEGAEKGAEASVFSPSRYLTGEDLQAYLEGFAAGFDQTVNREQYLVWDDRRLAVQRGEIPRPGEEELIRFRWQGQAERARRYLG